MSHLVIVQSIIRDPVAVDRACERLGWALQEQAYPQLWHGQGPMCAYVIQPAEHRRSIGLQATEDGSYRLIYDSMDRRYVDQLTQAYNYAVIEAQCALGGIALSETTLEDGTISLTLEGY